MGWTSCTSTMRPRHQRNTTTARASAARGKTMLSPREYLEFSMSTTCRWPFPENHLSFIHLFIIFIYFIYLQNPFKIKCASLRWWFNIDLTWKDCAVSKKKLLSFRANISVNKCKHLCDLKKNTICCCYSISSVVCISWSILGAKDKFCSISNQLESKNIENYFNVIVNTIWPQKD